MTRQEAIEKFPGSIRDIQNIKIGGWYGKIYSHCGGIPTVGKVTRIEFSIWGDCGDPNSSIEPIIHMVNPYSRWDSEQKEFYTFASDCGVTPYQIGSYNPTNYLVESSEQEAMVS